MTAPDDGRVASGLTRALVMLHHAQDGWIEDLTLVLRGDPAFTAAFRRWEERLTLIKLQVHRAEGRLLHFALMGDGEREDTDSPPEQLDRRRAAARTWRERLEAYFTAQRIDTAYRRLDSALDHDQEAMTADIITDLAALAEIAETTNAAIGQLSARADHAQLEELAFYRVLAPWKTQGMPALIDALRWLSEMLREQEDW